MDVRREQLTGSDNKSSLVINVAMHKGGNMMEATEKENSWETKTDMEFGKGSGPLSHL